MSIGFRKITPEEIRVKLAKMSDPELTQHGKLMKEFAQPSPGRGANEEWAMQLEEARAEWRRRHPKDEA
jgi:hypothetical protein